ncbi:fumarylacetoacetate hydrolase family protein [Acinetobacter sp. HY1485]|uniref:fumarylacetoacetate hydrolase family protein n=1 Tax=Acinetobacter sp. HY1485 TaxID=2970918 RepID=UPI0022B94896|nr:fumarylacetoacetate hydrolase family protein [Acinetobacter sp. HY1485]
MRPSKIVCLVRTYADHAHELGNEIPEQPMIFMKPPSALAELDDGVVWNKSLGSCHYECELSLRIDHVLKNETDPKKALQAVGAVTLGLDLTLRDIQSALKAKAQSWERAKAYDGSCILGEWVELSELPELDKIEYRLEIDGKIRQEGRTKELLFSIGELLCDISQTSTLEKGDVVMTGTPAGVGALNSNEQLKMILKGKTQDFCWKTTVR